METPELKCFEIDGNMFKSYYVVWKQSGVFHIFFQNKV